MISSPLVSIVMCVYNGEAYLEEAVRSILNQTYRHFEFIIINDGSTDQTMAILERLQAVDERIQVFHQANLGIYVSVNKGCRVARGKYIARFDADDIAFPQRLERQVGFLEQHSEVAVLGGAAVRIDNCGKTIDTFYTPTDASWIKKILPNWDPIIQPSTMFRKEAFEAVDGYREVFEVAGDYDLWIRMTERFEMVNLREPLIYWRMHSEEISHRRILKQAIYSLVALSAAKIKKKTGQDPLAGVDAIAPEILQKLGIGESQIRKLWITMCYLRSYLMLEADNKAQAEQLFNDMLAATRSHPFRKKIAAQISRLFIRSYQKRGQFWRNVLVFSWAGCAKPSYVIQVFRAKLRFFYYNAALKQAGLRKKRTEAAI